MFSALAMTKSTCFSRISPGSFWCRICRPGRPTMSPRARIRRGMKCEVYRASPTLATCLSRLRCRRRQHIPGSSPGKELPHHCVQLLGAVVHHEVPAIFDEHQLHVVRCTLELVGD